MCARMRVTIQCLLYRVSILLTFGVSFVVDRNHLLPKLFKTSQVVSALPNVFAIRITDIYIHLLNSLQYNSNDSPNGFITKAAFQISTLPITVKSPSRININP